MERTLVIAIVGLLSLIFGGNVVSAQYTWTDWSEWSDCDAGCGYFGETTRERTRDRPFGRDETESGLRQCVTPCENGGITTGYGCECIDGATGSCCESHGENGEHDIHF